MMNSTLKIADHVAVITFDPKIKMFRGEFVGLSGAADFYAYNIGELKEEGVKSLVIFFDECKKDGIEPYKLYSGNEIRGF
ncbi:type II toxin-antitoxin system HicB family antitoxin [Photorhabdus antumapuensis]|uniref:type II toxin-antitoxin system HicB family antitoxin n=1 Tax=Photorhabdus antumapuensis TaxID=2862867 RepID=UPI001CED7D2F|nr:type II toxin-antitoxin system HicB family antitoxin [Photorhabdus antumapuensis]